MNEDTEQKLHIPALTEEEKEEWRKVGEKLCESVVKMFEGLAAMAEEVNRHLEVWQHEQAETNKRKLTIVPPDNEQ